MQPDVLSLIFSIENFTKANEYDIKRSELICRMLGLTQRDCS